MKYCEPKQNENYNFQLSKTEPNPNKSIANRLKILQKFVINFGFLKGQWLFVDVWWRHLCLKC